MDGRLIDMEKKTVALTYIGIRIFNHEKGQVAKCFLTPKNKECFYTQLKGWYSIGHKYECSYDGGNYKMSSRANDLGEEKVDESKLEEWQNEDQEAKYFKDRVRIQKRMENKAKLFAKENYQLRRAIDGLSYMGLKYFVEALIDEADKINYAKRKENKK